LRFNFFPYDSSKRRRSRAKIGKNISGDEELKSVDTTNSLPAQKVELIPLIQHLVLSNVYLGRKY